jgi:DNA-binding MarR family transcriptional regulator
VRRQLCEEDGRGQLAVLTDEGFAALEAAAPVHVEGVRTHLFDLLTPEQVSSLRDIGETLVRHLRPTC